ncbi:MAG TPA: prolipoprotein diacylglyceryl transferase [Candidatus Baltobacteraceae bacterium]|nr:prolipoprotein diacylglyceryl transferase [Candidatus Baltobacteraceae bacterium]
MQHWFTYPNIDPVAFRLGPLALHWYGISYLVGFLVVGLWMARPAGRLRSGLSVDDVQDFLVHALVGVLVGGRIFFVIADIVTRRQLAYYLENPIHVIAVWNGGMGFFGGLVGVLLATALYLRKHPHLTFAVLTDELVMMLPVGIALTRMVNFINDELVGDVCNPDHPWCIAFPNYDGYRYPSQIFEGLLDLAVLPVLLLLARRRPPDGVVGWTWFTLYGVTRSIAELWRQTDLAVGPLTGGQLLALPMIAIGLFFLVRAARSGVRTERAAFADTAA